VTVAGVVVAGYVALAGCVSASAESGGDRVAGRGPSSSDPSPGPSGTGPSAELLGTERATEPADRETKAGSTAESAAPSPGGPKSSGSESSGRTAEPRSDQALCPLPDTGFDCDLQRRIQATTAYVAGRPGVTGIVVRDRKTGGVWSNEHANRLVFTASTVKLAVAVDLLGRERSGALRLSATDHDRIEAMLHSSDDAAADTLWYQYGGDEIGARFRFFGMSGATYVPGLARKWGSMKSTTADLDRLMVHVLERTPVDIREQLMAGMRTVAPNQRWGVWSAGPAASPGTKNGWHDYGSGWVINSFGFVGPDGRYTLAMMNDLVGEGGYEDGVKTTSQVATMLFAGRFPG
jgi:hypothetical protein